MLEFIRSLLTIATDWTTKSNAEGVEVNILHTSFHLH